MNRKYWEKRQVQKMFETMGLSELVADEISKLYYRASKWLESEIQKIWKRYQTKHKLSDKETQVLLQQVKDKTSVQEIKQALGNSNKEHNRLLLAELDSPAYAYRIERLRNIASELDLFMENIYKQEKEYHITHYKKIAKDTYYQTIFDIQKRSGYGFSFATFDPKMIEKLLCSKWSGENYSKRIWRNTKALAQTVKEELLINLLTGRTNQEAANNIAKKFQQSASNARRLIRTESCYISNQMEMESYEECGIETYIFLATLDLKTSETCQKLDNKRFLVKEQQVGVSCPPMHPWCRSTTLCDITEKELEHMKRRAFDPKTGRTKLVSATMSYAEWKKLYVV